MKKHEILRTDCELMITFNFLNLETLYLMNLPYFIAQRLIKGRREETSFSRPINVIAIIGIAMGLAVMILAVAILTGFKKRSGKKLSGSDRISRS